LFTKKYSQKETIKSSNTKKTQQPIKNHLAETFDHFFTLFGVTCTCFGWGFGVEDF